jgi:hypothetical protein
MKPTNVSGIRRGNVRETKNNELATSSKDKNITDLYRRINELKRPADK